MPWWDGKEKKPIDRSRSEGQKLLSTAYRAYLGRLLDEETRQRLKLPEGATWADAVAVQTLKRAVGLISKEQICFTAITELRESTEGKNPERLVTAGNEELAALAKVIAGPPALEDGTHEQ